MKSPRGATTAAPSGRLRFDERLAAPLWWWLPALVIIALVYLDVRLGHPRWPDWPVVVLLVPLAAFAFHRIGRARVTVREDDAGQTELRVGAATLPCRFVAQVGPVTAEGKQQALGPDLDPAAYVLHKAWVGPLVRVTLRDPTDPTPYWLFSTRRPAALVECIRASLNSDRGANPE